MLAFCLKTSTASLLFILKLLTAKHISADLQEQVSKEDEIEDGEDFSLTAKMKMVMGVCQTVQNSLDLVASYCERVKKYVTFHHSNPFNISCTFLKIL